MTDLILGLIGIALAALGGVFYLTRRRKAHRQLLKDNDANAAARASRSRTLTPPVPMRTFGQAHPQAPQPRMPARPDSLLPLPPLDDDKPDKDK
jgi:LPXTG-motif cell wall-anchored protein